MRQSVILAVLALAVSVVGTASSAPQPRFFPLADGNRWVLSDVETGATTVISARRQPAGLVLRGFPGTRDLRVRAVGQTVQAWDAADSRWENLLRLGDPAGTKYVVRLSGTDVWRSVVVTVASRQVEVEDNAGRVRRGCVRLAFRQGGKLVDAGLEELTFAPGVGLVRIVEQTIAGPRTKLLGTHRVRATL